MRLLNGDVDALYRALSRRSPAPGHALRELDDLRAMRRFYDSLSADDRRLLRARMKKEARGIGMIPVALSTLPLLTFVFARQLERQVALVQDRALWLLAAAFVLGLAALYIHHRQRALATLHLTLLDDAIAAEQQRP